MVRLDSCPAAQRALSIVLIGILYPDVWIYHTLINPLLMNSWAVSSLLLWTTSLYWVSRSFHQTLHKSFPLILDTSCKNYHIWNFTLRGSGGGYVFQKYSKSIVSLKIWGFYSSRIVVIPICISISNIKMCLISDFSHHVLTRFFFFLIWYLFKNIS